MLSISDVLSSVVSCESMFKTSVEGMLVSEGLAVARLSLKGMVVSIKVVLEGVSLLLSEVSLGGGGMF